MEFNENSTVYMPVEREELLKHYIRRKNRLSNKLKDCNTTDSVEAYRLRREIRKNERKIKNLSQNGLPKENKTAIIIKDRRTDAPDDDVRWITVNGAHVPITKGGTVASGPLKGKKLSEAKSKNSSEESAQGKAPTKSTRKLVIDTPEAREMYENIKAGKYYTAEEMANSPVMKQLDAESDRWKNKYPELEKDMSPERVAMREQIKNDFLAMGSAVKGEDGEYSFTGEVKRGFEAEVVIGLPASGKSTTIANPDSETKKAFVFDSDIIKESIPEFKESKGAAANAVHNESKKILKDAFNQFKTGGARNGDNLIVPVIGDDYGSLVKKWIDPLQKSGYKVKVKYKDTDPVRSLNRNIGRAISSGRIIPSDVALKYGNKPAGVYEECKHNGLAE